MVYRNQNKAKVQHTTQQIDRNQGDGDLSVGGLYRLWTRLSSFHSWPPVLSSFRLISSSVALVGLRVLRPREVNEFVGLIARVDTRLENLGRDVAKISLKGPVL